MIDWILENIEDVLLIGARLGIIGAHAFEFIGGIHTVTIVAILWSIEELIAIRETRKQMNERNNNGKQRIAKTFGRISHLRGR